MGASLVLSNLVGHDSHGIIRLVQYSEWIAHGQIRPTASPAVKRRQRGTVVIDGNWGFGQLAAQMAVDVLIAAAAENGVAAVMIGHCNHVGRLGEYVTALADHGLAGLAFCNSGSPSRRGEAGRALGTNPFAWAAPWLARTARSSPTSRPRRWPRAS